MPPPNMSLGEKDYFEQKAIENQQMQEEPSSHPPPTPPKINCLKAGHTFLFVKVLTLLHQERKSDSYHLRWRVDR